ncbi:hypothetical protein [Bartonella bovis]|nr:hypothetical protein [Bartonella bovis]
MVMRCVFKHHVYLCVVSTALMAGLALTSHTSKAYAKDQNCGSRGSGAKVVSGNEPIVCDGGVTRILSSISGGGEEIKINMDEDMGSGEGCDGEGWGRYYDIKEAEGYGEWEWKEW